MRGRDITTGRTAVDFTPGPTPPGPFLAACGKWWRRECDDLAEAVRKARKVVAGGKADHCAVYSVSTGRKCAEVRAVSATAFEVRE